MAIGWGALVAALAAVGLYLSLPRRHGTASRLVGHLVAALALILTWGLLRAVPKQLGLTLVTYLAGTVAIVAAFLMVTRRSPVATALWFATSVVAGAVLMFAAGAQFLGVATVIVYAGAVIVMFLFVIMLAQQEGWAPCDREAHEPALASVALAFLLGSILATSAGYDPKHAYIPLPSNTKVSEVAAIQPEQPHTAGLGTLLFSEHVLTIELVGTVLLVAMVGAVMIAARKLIPGIREP